MTTYNTGNPVPSADARDRYDNSQTLDEVVNGDSASYTARTGNQVISLGGMNSRFNNAQDARESAFNLSQEEKQEEFQSFLDGSGWSSLGAYGAGVVITSHTQTVDYLGQPYALKPSIPASLDAPYVTTGVWATEGVNFKLVGDNSLRQDLADPTDPSLGAAILGRAVLSLKSMVDLLATPSSSLRTDLTYRLTSYLPASVAPFSNPIGGGDFIWLPTQAKSAHNGVTVFSPTVPWNGTKAALPAFMAKTGETSPGGSGCFVRIVEVLYDVMGGVTHDSSDETAIHQGVLNSLKDGAAYRLSGVSKVSTLTCNANSVSLDSVGSPYSEGGGGFETIGSGRILTVGGYGWTVSKTVFRDTRPDLGSTTAGTCGLWFERYATTVDLDAAVDRCLFSKLDQAVGGKGINVKITSNIFSYCRYSVDAYQLGSSQFRGWIVTGSNRFHGRAFDGGAHIRTTGPITASEFNKNFHDDGYKAYEGQLDRTASFSDNEIRGSFSPDYAIDVTGGAYGVVSLNRLGSIGSGGAIRATNTSQLTVFGNSADSVRKHGVSLVNSVNGFIKSNVLTNVNILNATDGDIYDGINLDATSNSNELEGNVTRQIGAKGRYGIRNEGSGNYFGINQSSGYVSGDYYQSPTVEAYGYTWNGLVRPRVEYLPAMPTTGRWRRNDIIWSTVAAAGQPMGWICIVAGIAGSTAVFKAMPNLAA